jgi:hypothetical protein
VRLAAAALFAIIGAWVILAALKVL